MIIVYEIIYFWQAWKRTKHSWQAKLNTSKLLPDHATMATQYFYTIEKKEITTKQLPRQAECVYFVKKLLSYRRYQSTFLHLAWHANVLLDTNHNRVNEKEKDKKMRLRELPKVRTVDAISMSNWYSYALTWNIEGHRGKHFQCTFQFVLGVGIFDSRYALLWPGMKQGTRGKVMEEMRSFVCSNARFTSRVRTNVRAKHCNFFKSSLRGYMGFKA